MAELPPVTHVYIGKNLTRIDQLTLEQARGVIARLCDELEDVRADLALARRQPKGGAGNLMTSPPKTPS